MELSREGVSSYYDNLMEGPFGFIVKLWFEHRGKVFARELVKAGEVHRGDAVLDVGCGTGDFLFELARRVESAGLYYGIDISDAMLRFSAAKSKRYGLNERLKIVRADALDMPFKDESFDVITAFGISKHFEDDLLGALFREVRRVIKPDGRILVADYGHIGVGLLDDLTERAFKARLRCEHEIASHLESAGFTGLKSVPYGEQWWPPFIPKIAVRAVA